jgi:hypothetical protein
MPVLWYGRDFSGASVHLETLGSALHQQGKLCLACALKHWNTFFSVLLFSLPGNNFGSSQSDFAAVPDDSHFSMQFIFLFPSRVTRWFAGHAMCFTCVLHVTSALV